MSSSMPDLNLLITLDVLLAEGHVARAAKRLRLSASAMSRTLARLRETTGDPLLVRAGRQLVPTPHALALRERVGQLVQEAESVLRPARAPEPAQLSRSFTLRSRDGFVENFGPALIARISAEAPGVRLRFLQKADRDNAPLRDGLADLEIGVVGDETSADLRVQALYRDRWVGVVRPGHALARGAMTAARYASGRHIGLSRLGRQEQDRMAIDDALQAAGFERRIVTVVGSFSTALALVRGTDLVASVPERHTARLREGLRSFALPVDVPGMTVSMLWHPRLHADPAHRWFRDCVRAVCADAPAVPAAPVAR
jgi:DNA-binding transcriptional LysR family regulator